MAAPRRRLGIAALAFGLAAAVSSWNPLAAPFGLVVGLVTIVLSIRALRLGEGRSLAAAGLGLSVLAVLASGLVLALTAGIGREPGGAAVVEAPPAGEVTRELDESSERTRDARERARRELEAVDGGPAGGAPERRPPGGGS